MVFPHPNSFCDSFRSSQSATCGKFDTANGCTKPCAQVCYPTTTTLTQIDPNFYINKVNGAADVAAYDQQFTGASSRQCMNIGSYVSNGQALKQAQGAFWGSIVIVQIAGLLCAKTRWLSLRSQGMKNSFMNFGIFFELLLVSWLAYCPPINGALGTANIRLTHWFCAIPFAIFIFIYDETRKALMRSTSPEKVDPATGQVTRTAGWLERMTYY